MLSKSPGKCFSKGKLKMVGWRIKYLQCFFSQSLLIFVVWDGYTCPIHPNRYDEPSSFLKRQTGALNVDESTRTGRLDSSLAKSIRFTWSRFTKDLSCDHLVSVCLFWKRQLWRPESNMAGFYEDRVCLFCLSQSFILRERTFLNLFGLYRLPRSMSVEIKRNLSVGSGIGWMATTLFSVKQRVCAICGIFS